MEEAAQPKSSTSTMYMRHCSMRTCFNFFFSITWAMHLAVTFGAWAQDFPFERALFVQDSRMSGDDVVRLQQRLADLSYLTQTEIDGYFGPITKRAFDNFAYLNDISIDFSVDFDDWNALFSADAIPYAEPNDVPYLEYSASTASIIAHGCLSPADLSVFLEDHQQQSTNG